MDHISPLAVCHNIATRIQFTYPTVQHNGTTPNYPLNLESPEAAVRHPVKNNGINRELYSVKKEHRTEFSTPDVLKGNMTRTPATDSAQQPAKVSDGESERDPPLQNPSRVMNGERERFVEMSVPQMVTAGDRAKLERPPTLVHPQRPPPFISGLSRPPSLTMNPGQAIPTITSPTLLSPVPSSVTLSKFPPPPYPPSAAGWPWQLGMSVLPGLQGESQPQTPVTPVMTPPTSERSSEMLINRSDKAIKTESVQSESPMPKPDAKDATLRGKQRKRCGSCDGCLRTTNCGSCSVCNAPKGNRCCMLRRCEARKSPTKVSVCACWHLCTHTLTYTHTHIRFRYGNTLMYAHRIPHALTYTEARAHAHTHAYTHTRTHTCAHARSYKAPVLIWCIGYSLSSIHPHNNV